MAALPGAMPRPEGDRLITLIEPGPPVTDSFGDVRRPEAARHQVYARAMFGMRREGMTTGVVSGPEPVRWTVRERPALAGLDATWSLIDDGGRPHDITSVQPVSEPRDRHVWIFSVHRGGA